MFIIQNLIIIGLIMYYITQVIVVLNSKVMPMHDAPSK